jgi:hypothetical protein
MAAKQKMVPRRHCHTFLALSRNGKDGSGMNKCAALQRCWWQCGQQCLCIVGRSLLPCVTLLMAAAWMTVYGKDGGRAEDCALAPLLAVPCPRQRRQRHEQQCATMRWCHGGIVSCSLPSCAMATMSVAQTSERATTNGGCVNDYALALLVIPHLFV